VFEAAQTGASGIIDGFGRISAKHFAALTAAYSLAYDTPRAVALAYAAAQQALQQAGWGSLQADDGLIVATTAGANGLWEDAIVANLKSASSTPSRQVSDSIPLDTVINQLGQLLHFSGRSLLLASACSAATQAIGIGALWIQQNKVKRCLVGGTEALSQLTVEGFRSLQLLSSEPASPFDVERTGINLSEAAGFLCLERTRTNPLAFIRGWGFSTDAYHMAAPHPQGAGSLRAMQQALHRAQVESSAVDWVHAHGTGSKANDSAEGQAIFTLFGENQPWVTSTKHTHGHALGASGALETVLCIESMRRNCILRTAGLSHADPKIPLRHALSNHTQSVNYLLKNTLGFGGNNAALVLSSAT